MQLSVGQPCCHRRTWVAMSESLPKAEVPQCPHPHLMGKKPSVLDESHLNEHH